MLSTDLLLLLLTASCFAQQVPQSRQPPLEPNFANTCSVQSTTITCTCNPGLKVLNLTPSFMENSGEGKELRISGCSSVTFSFLSLQKLQKLFVSNTASATFQEKMSQPLRHLELLNVSRVELTGPIFKGTDLETLLLDGVRFAVVTSGAFANVNKIQNVTFRDVHIESVEEGAIGFQMGSNSEFTITNSELLGIQKSGFVVKGVAHFTMQESKLTTVGDGGLQVEATGPVSISNSQLQTVGSLKLAVPAGTTFTFDNNVVSGSLQVAQLAQQLVVSGAILKVSRNTFNCSCDANIASFTKLPEVKPLLDSNLCDGLCSRPVKMNFLTSCDDKAVLEAACKNAPLDPYSAPTAKPRTGGSNNTAAAAAAAIAISMGTALLLVLPTAAALAV